MLRRPRRLNGLLTSKRNNSFRRITSKGGESCSNSSSPNSLSNSMELLAAAEGATRET